MQSELDELEELTAIIKGQGKVKPTFQTAAEIKPTFQTAAEVYEEKKVSKKTIPKAKKSPKVKPKVAPKPKSETEEFPEVDEEIDLHAFDSSPVFDKSPKSKFDEGSFVEPKVIEKIVEVEKRVEVPIQMPITSMSNNDIAWQQARLNHWELYLTLVGSILKFDTMHSRRRYLELLNLFFGLPVFHNVKEYHHYRDHPTPV